MPVSYGQPEREVRLVERLVFDDSLGIEPSSGNVDGQGGNGPNGKPIWTAATAAPPACRATRCSISNRASRSRRAVSM